MKLFSKKLVTDDNLYSLPFDQFSRQLHTKKIIESIRAIQKEKKLSILDIGGYKGKTAEFQNNDTVTITDLGDVDEPNYVKTDGKSLPFSDDEFDVSVSFDTYEHVPRKMREQFIENALRVSKTVHILAAPFDDNDGLVYDAEVAANKVYRNMFHNDHRWLKEHIDYRTPSTNQFEEFCHKKKIFFFKIQTNDINLWLRMQSVFFTAEKHFEVFPYIKEINETYNRNMDSIETLNTESTYRTTYCLSYDKVLIDKIKNTYETSKKEKSYTSDEARRNVYLLDIAIQKAYLGLLKQPR